MSIARHVKNVALAVCAVGTSMVLSNVYAAGTDAGVSVSNRATVTYSVGSVAQPPIESSPEGNSTPGAGAGADTTFLVDRRIFVNVSANAPTSPTTTPGATAVVRSFTVSNSSNAPLQVTFDAQSVIAGNDFNVTDAVVFVDSAIQPSGSYAVGSYDALTDVGTSLPVLPEDHSVTVFVVANVPLTATNGQEAQVNLQATLREPADSTWGTPNAEVVETAGANTSGVDTVFGSITASALNVYSVASASLSVTKTVEIIDDPINGAGANRKAIPGATLEYTIAVENAGGEPAASVVVADTIPAGTAYVPGSIRVNASPAADAGNTVGDPVTGLNVATGLINAGASATVSFRVTIDAN